MRTIVEWLRTFFFLFYKIHIKRFESNVKQCTSVLLTLQMSKFVFTKLSHINTSYRLYVYITVNFSNDSYNKYLILIDEWLSSNKINNIVYCTFIEVGRTCWRARDARGQREQRCRRALLIHLPPPVCNKQNNISQRYIIIITKIHIK